MQISLEDFENKVLDPKKMRETLEQRAAWIAEFKSLPPEQLWRTYLATLGSLAARGVFDLGEFTRYGPDQHADNEAPTPERLYSLTVLVDMLR